MGYSSFNDGNFHQVLLGVVNTFGNGVSYFVGFTKTVTHNAVSIAYYNDGCETEPATAFHHFRYAFNGYNFFFQVDFAGFYSANIAYRHILNFLCLEFQPTFSG